MGLALQFGLSQHGIAKAQVSTKALASLSLGLYFSQLSIQYFKSYQQASLALCPRINVLLGPNGVGKTNLLDAIYCLALTRSAFNAEEQNLGWGAPWYALRGTVQLAEQDELNLQMSRKEEDKRLFKIDGEPLQKLAEHIGRIPTVLIAPNDPGLITEGSEGRRKFFDGLLSQLSALYLEQLLGYNSVLAQKNAYLKYILKERARPDHALLDSYDRQLADLGKELVVARQGVMQEFLPYFYAHYTFIAGSDERPLITYETAVDTAGLPAQLSQYRQADLNAGRGVHGPHKDDYLCDIEGKPARKYASQGQLKSFTIALKLAQYDLLASRHGRQPILLLDDIFDRLDEQRITALLRMIASDKFGQVFITDARPERSKALLADLPCAVKAFLVKEGSVQPFDLHA